MCESGIKYLNAACNLFHLSEKNLVKGVSALYLWQIFHFNLFAKKMIYLY